MRRNVKMMAGGVLYDNKLCRESMRPYMNLEYIPSRRMGHHGTWLVAGDGAHHGADLSL